MPAKPANPQPVPRQWQSFLSRVESTVTARKLTPVLESLPAATKFRFYEANVFKKRTLKFEIGLRRQMDGVVARSWAYILLDSSDNDPPVLFYDEPLTTVSNAHPKIYPRAASSLVRHATDLSAPFRFLSVNTYDNATNSHGMVCSLVAFYALSSGLNDCAIKWAKFESSFIRALEYIDGSGAYGRWLGGEGVDPDATLEEHMSDAEDAPIDGAGASATDDVSHSDSSENDNTVRSSGSSVTITPGCTLAKLRVALGNRFSLLDAIPSVPITIEPQASFPKYFPFRLHLGNYRGSKVYVYLTRDGKTTMKKVIAHRANGDQLWAFHELEQIDLVKPFDFLMSYGRTDASTRGSKVRCSVGYYFMLAENAGMIGDPHLKADSRNMLAMLSASCGDLEKQNRDAGYNAEQSGPSRATQSGPSKAAKTVPQMQSLPAANGAVRTTRNMAKITRPSLIVKFTIRPGFLASIDRPSAPSQRSEGLNVEVDGPVNVVGGGLRQQRQEFEKRSRCPAVPKQYGRLKYSRRLHEDTIMGGIQKTGHSKQGSYRNRSYDSGFASSAPLLATTRTTANHTRHAPAEKPDENMDARSMTAGADEYQGNEPLDTLPETSTTLPAVDNRNAPRSASVVSINHARDVPGNGSEIAPARAQRTTLFAPRHEAWPRRESNVIDLCSEGEKSVIAESLKREIEETPEVEEALSSRRRFRGVPGDSELHLPPQSGSRRQSQAVSDDEDMLMEMDGDA